MLSDPATWARFDDIVLVHSVRTTSTSSCGAMTIERWHATAPRGGARLRYVPTLTGREETALCHGRITTLLAESRLESVAGLPLTVDDARLMMCGNPSMIKEVRALLGERGFTPVRRATPGQYVVENFW